MDFVGRRGRFPIRMAKFSGANSLLVSGGWPGWWQTSNISLDFFHARILGEDDSEGEGGNLGLGG